MDRWNIGVGIFAIVVAAKFDLATDSAILVVLAIGIAVMGIGVYKQKTTAE